MRILADRTRIHNAVGFTALLRIVSKHWAISIRLLKVHKHEIFKIPIFAETESLWPQGPVTRDFEIRIWFSRNIRLLIISAYEQPAMKSIPRMLSERWNKFRVCLTSDEIRSAYAQHILNDDFEMGCDFPLCWECAIIGYSLTEHARKLVTCWLSKWACAKNGYLLLSMRENWLLGSWA